MSEPVNPLTGGRFAAQSAVTGGAVAAVLGAMHLCATAGGAVTISAPAAPPDGSIFAVFDADGNASVNNITINGGAELIDDAASLVLVRDGAVAVLLYDDGQWRRMSVRRLKGTSLVQLERDSDGGAGLTPSGGAGIVQTDDGAGGLAGAADVKAGASYLSTGPLPSQTGLGLRLARGQGVYSRNAANTADLPLLSYNAFVYVGDSTGTDAGLLLYSGAGVSSIVAGVVRESSTAALKSLAVPLAIGAIPAQSGDVRLTNAGSIRMRDVAGTSDLSLLDVNASNVLHLGTDTAYTASKQVGGIKAYCTTGGAVAMGVAGTTMLYLFGGNVETWKPLTGSASGSSPYSAHGGVEHVFDADANYNVTAAKYAYDLQRFETGALLVTRWVIYPLPATMAAGYYKTVVNNTAFDLTISAGGVGTTVSVLAGTVARIWFDNAGAKAV